MRPPNAYVVDVSPVPLVVVPANVAAFLLERTNLAQARTAHRGRDSEVDTVLLALTVEGQKWRASALLPLSSESSGSSLDAPTEAPRELTSMSTGQAARRLGVTSRAIRLACVEGRLTGQLVDGRWLIQTDDLEQFRSNRSAA